MDLSGRISRRITDMIADMHKGLSEDEIEKINYGLMILISNSFKLFVILLIAALLGVFKLALITFFVFGILRTFAGGVHAKTSLQCLLSVMFIYFAVIYGAIYIPCTNLEKFLLFTVNIVLIMLFAPADTVEKPIIGEKHRRNLRYMALATMLILYVISLFSTEIVSKVIIFASFAECLTITPVAYIIARAEKGGDVREENVQRTKIKTCL